MADPTPQVNQQITDAVTQVNVKNVGESPWAALAVAGHYLREGSVVGMRGRRSRRLPPRRYSAIILQLPRPRSRE